MSIIFPQLLNTAEAAQLLGVSQGTLANWRFSKRIALPYVKIGASIRYRKEDLLAFIEKGLVDPEDPLPPTPASPMRAKTAERA